MASLAEEFTRHINQFEGPIDAHILAPKCANLPSLILFGDLHEGEFKCSNATCLSFYNESFLSLLNEFSRLKGITTDFYIEHWGDLVEPLNCSSALEYIINNIQKYKLNYEQIEIHFGDPRKVSNCDLIGDQIIGRFFVSISDDTSLYKFLVFCKVKFGAEYKMLEVVRQILQIKSLQDYFNIPFIKRFSRTYHQFNKLPLQIKEEIYNRHEKFFYTMTNDRRQKIQQVKMIIDKLIAGDTFPIDIDPDIDYHLFEVLFAPLVDIYIISSICISSHFVVTYLGQAHSIKIMSHLAKFYDVKYSYYQASPKCIVKHESANIHDVVNSIIYKKDVVKFTDWINVKNLFEESLLEISIKANYLFCQKIIESISNADLINFRSSTQCSIFSLVVENNLGHVLGDLLKRLIPPKGLLKIAILHHSFECLEVLIQSGYSRKELIKIGTKTMSAFDFAISQKFIDACRILYST